MTKYLKFIVFTTFMIGSTEASYADFGFIQDKDGYVNVRENSSLSSKVTTKLNNNEIVSCVMDEETNNFCLVNASNGVTGFFYKNIIVEVYAKNLFQILSCIKLLKVNINTLMIKKFFGTDGSLPDNNFLQLDKIIVKEKDNIIEIIRTELEQYFFPKDGVDGGKNELADFKIYYLNNNIYILNTFNNGGTAAYNIVLNMKNGKVVANKAWKVEI